MAQPDIDTVLEAEEHSAPGVVQRIKDVASDPAVAAGAVGAVAGAVLGAVAGPLGAAAGAAAGAQTGATISDVLGAGGYIESDKVNLRQHEPAYTTREATTAQNLALMDAEKQDT